MDKKTRRKSSIFTLPAYFREEGEAEKYDFTTLSSVECGIEVGHFFTIDEDAHSNHLCATEASPEVHVLEYRDCS